MSSRSVEPGVPQVAIPCRGCGYDLRGLERGVPCPECGLAAVVARHGDLATVVDPALLRRFCLGAFCLALSPIMVVLAPVLILILSAILALLERPFAVVITNHVSSATIVTAVVPGTVGLWLLTAGHPSELIARPRPLLRHLGRALAALALAALLLELGGWLTSPAGVHVAAFFLIPLLWLAGLVVLRQLALRLPDRALAQRLTSPIRILFGAEAIGLGISMLSVPRLVRGRAVSGGLEDLACMAVGMLAITWLVAAFMGSQAFFDGAIQFEEARVDTARRQRTAGDEARDDEGRAGSTSDDEDD